MIRDENQRIVKKEKAGAGKPGSVFFESIAGPMDQERRNITVHGLTKY